MIHRETNPSSQSCVTNWAENPLCLQRWCLTFTRQTAVYLQTGIQGAQCITQAETTPRPISPHPEPQEANSYISRRCRFTSPAAVPSDSTACPMTKASTGMTMIWNLSVICSLTANFSRSAQASRPSAGLASASRRSRLMCRNPT